MGKLFTEVPLVHSTSTAKKTQPPTRQVNLDDEGKIVSNLELRNTFVQTGELAATNCARSLGIS
ncbi:MAG: hypothetical protein A3D44_00550 [Candidatus Staskawiczbacteria bacterium RIFCSPHIGHO2_02_FULL_42_22]|uniref:Uncharacterized protein n=1 Tax=Candidatus Staskawiczbacteria bacterium RIFCSPHIGHO2_02_FULL_42_22 TaxID=1802207 RepID=A0A1G2I166_9BACT|nr:MAG: hypothetical protein A3D44_00550 [Candidatus Staskawiczbacteria bacterium RIFCSPHIGHO2_02_FULL_42_22]